MSKLPINHPAVSAAVATERGRIFAIVNSPEGRSRRDAALQLALSSDLPMQTAIELLAKMPEETSSKFLAAMEGEAISFNGNVGSANNASDPKAARLADIKAATAHLNQLKGYGRTARD